VRSGPVTSIPSTASPTRITTPVNPGLPISAGDYVAVDVLDATSALAQRTANGEGFGYHLWTPPLSDGATRAPDFSSPVREILYQATIEPNGAINLCKGQQATISGTSGSDSIKGTSGHDVVAALAGKDKVSGLAANDLICGGAGKDTLNGGAGKDKLLGQKGADTLKGGGGNDTCKGGKGRDVEKSC
jgi:Ca2+-binding RTX toxin-like protein